MDNNTYNIINFEDSFLLDKAKEKALFLAFCIEYRKFVSFLKDDNLIEFSTYLPLQLDATCNGFIHLSLLSRESKLYEVLNLTNYTKIPKDFYSFLLFKLENNINTKIKEGILIEGKGSFERLKSFMLNRTHVKKVIMNIPYNAIPLPKGGNGDGD